jgi:glycosyltransferase involved in cell wall biosynthesis
MLSAGGMVGTLAWAIAREGHRGGAELVHAHWWIPGGLAAWLASWAGGPPYVVTLHGTDVALLERSAPLRTLARRVLRSAAGVTAVSSYLAERAARVAGIDPARITVQPMPVEVERFDRLSTGGGGVATVGRLTAQKRVDVVLDAVAWLAAQGRPLELTVVGDGPERAALEARVEEAGLGGRVRFTGAVPPERIPEVIGDSDVFAFAAEREGLGLALGEALMLGVPVVAVESGGVSDLVPAQGGGRLVPAGDAAALGAAIAELLDDAPASRQAAASAGRELMKRLGSDSAAAVLDAVYAAALDREAARA